MFREFILRFQAFLNGCRCKHEFFLELLIDTRNYEKIYLEGLEIRNKVHLIEEFSKQSG